MTPTSVQLYSHLQLRTTGEPVFVLDAAAKPGYFLVRRPVQTRDGLQHVQESFHAEELEAPSDALHREIDQMVERQVYADQASKQASAAIAKTDQPKVVKPN